jgi:DNA polymerase-4
MKMTSDVIDSYAWTDYQDQDSSNPRAILHLDMDAFFVNVHILENPEDANIPLAVGGRPDQRGVIASASYEAREFGVRSAMPSSRAMRLCPQLKIVGHTWNGIRRYSKQVMEILTEYGPVEKMSVDEAYVDLCEKPDPVSVAGAIRTRVKDETGLPASVGLATSKLVAKIASDHEKPDGFTIIQPGDEASFLRDLSVRVIWGIGPRTTERLAELDIKNCGQLANAKETKLEEVFGRHAASLKQRAKGIDHRPVNPERGPPKSISNEWTFNQDIREIELLLAKLENMCESVGSSLGRQELLAQTVFVKFRWSDFTTFTRQRTSLVPLESAEEIFQLAREILIANWNEERPMRLLGVGVRKLREAAIKQLTLGI